MTDSLLLELAADAQARLKWLVCRELGIVPGSWRWHAMTRRRVLRLACHLALDARISRGASERAAARGFDMERFRELGGGA